MAFAVRRCKQAAVLLEDLFELRVESRDRDLLLILALPFMDFSHLGLMFDQLDSLSLVVPDFFKQVRVLVCEVVAMREAKRLSPCIEALLVLEARQKSLDLLRLSVKSRGLGLQKGENP
eukprot:CAMPEP_0204896200 /NCGR_PEP_ID=MMETSP1397-20131031/21_1 /ASSEMBLY_ACC=CAM_ASM_000891 /TAXON_ID=49980 /ORGANISM="Climacostomum Climacostomum virens, Strain Stock W-24" /LENGTH=118 /DNA_ID=CAMNT_0052063775 /DNA_START=98 /DNA_END=452 /DNA_ORIENTATION=-